MAKVNFNDALVAENNSASSAADQQVSFFALKADGEDAIVRFWCDSVDDFDILTVHPVSVNGRIRNVNCLRGPYDPLTDCPFCANEMKINQRFYIKMIEYVRDSQGRMQPMPRVWDRSVAYARTLKSYIENFGPLSDVICKVIRHGKPADMATTYEIVPNLPKTVYPDEIYVKPTDPFAGYDVATRAVISRNADDMRAYLQTGNFPAPQRANNQQSNATVRPVSTAQPAAAAQPMPAAPMQPQYAAPANAAPQPAFGAAPASPVGYNPAPAATPGNTAPMNTMPFQGAPQRTPMAWDKPATSSTTAPAFERPRRY